MSASIANPFPLGTKVITGNPGPMVPSRSPGVVKPQAIGGVPVAPQPQVVAAQLAAAQQAGQSTVNIGGTQVTVQPGSATLTVGGVTINASVPPGTDLSSLLSSLFGALTGQGASGGCGDCA
jgi:hypothetical protein